MRTEKERKSDEKARKKNGSLVCLFLFIWPCVSQFQRFSKAAFLSLFTKLTFSIPIIKY